MAELTDREKKAYAGRCGLYCGACQVYRSEREDPEMRKKVAEWMNCAIDEAKCNGCGDFLDDSWGKDCSIVKCLKEKGFEYCYECTFFDTKMCKDFEGVAERYLKTGMDIRRNLLMIKEGKLDEFLNECHENFTCPHCGKQVMYWRTDCHHCGGEIEIKPIE